MKEIRRRLTYANVMATIAVFIALGGASYAAIQLPKNSVGTRQLKKNAISTAKIRARAVTGAKIRLKTLGTVPRAARASFADAAANADSLTGLPPSAFASASQLIRGTGNISAATAQTILTLPGGLSMLTKPGDSEKVTMKAAPGAEWTVGSDATEATLLGGKIDLTIDGNLEVFFAMKTAAPERWFIDCYYGFSAGSIACFGVGG